jgi:hypothetical protein
MKAYRTVMIIFIVLSVVLSGLVVYFYQAMLSSSKTEKALLG